MPEFKISCDWKVYGHAYVEADNFKQAIEKAKEVDFPLPTDTNYVDESFKVDMESTIAFNNFFTVHDVIEAECNLEPIVCFNCGSLEVTFNQRIGDGYCGDCGEWQLDFLSERG